MVHPELAALREECESIDSTLAGISGEAWTGPGLGEWNLAELVAHMVGGVERISTYLAEPVPDGAELVDPVEYFGFDADEVSAGVAQRARDRLARTEPGALPGEFRAAWRAAFERAAAEPAGRVMPTFGGPMRLQDYLVTRVLEAVVHHIDVRTALGLPPAATIAAARITMDVLEGLLGSPRPRNLGRTRFIRAATGRVAVDDPRFPVLR